MTRKAKTSESVKAIVLLNNGEINEINIPKSTDIDKLDINKFPVKAVSLVGKGTIERECDFTYNDKVLSIFAWSNGKAGTENKHDLPPPIDKELYFGNIFVIYHQKNKVINLSEKSYRDFYEIAFGGFEDLGSEDSWSTEEELASDDSLNDFIVDDESDTSREYLGSSENDPSLTSGSDTSVSEVSIGSDSTQNTK